MAGQVYVWEEVGVLLPRYSNAFPISDNLRFSDGLRSQERVRASDLVLTIRQHFRLNYIIFQTIFRPGHLRIYSSLSFLFKDKKELKQKKKKKQKSTKKREKCVLQIRSCGFPRNDAQFQIQNQNLACTKL